jgi:hypothetical protein
VDCAIGIFSVEELKVLVVFSVLDAAVVDMGADVIVLLATLADDLSVEFEM